MPEKLDRETYLRRILTARVYDVAHESALDEAHRLSRRIGNKVLLKREDTQPVFSFKLRGAFNKMVHLTQEERARGVICASAGNHAQGVALAAKRLGCRAVIVMPVTAPLLKVEAVRNLGGEVVLVGESFSDAAQHAAKMQEEEGLTFVHPFDDPLVIAGQGTIGMEILRQYQPGDGSRPDAIFVQIGGGGLAAGVATYIKALYPEMKVIGVETEDSDAMKRSIDAGENVTLDDVGLFSDGTAVKRVGDETLRLCKENLDDIILVSSDEICAAIKDIFEDTRTIVEPSGALSLAGLKAWVRRENAVNKTLVAITSGANMNFDRLRFVSERAEFGEEKEAVFAVTIPEERGSFRRLCKLVGSRNVTEFNYRMSDAEKAYIFVGIQTANSVDADKLVHIFKESGFDTLNLTHDELAKLHLRHMVGGHSKLAVNEHLLRFEFPERPGALTKFLTSMAPQWNISLFHYRNNGADFGRVFVGIQVPPEDGDLFNEFLNKLGYRYWEETNNPACRFFLG
ncbi:MAG: threonine ammonia-lyase, biosynthetic [Sutterellaceae bacterium]|nr:threonine ammonia-lyase, biosynthetic [Sutterellaceae bacterium]